MIPGHDKHGAVAQLVAHLHGMQGVRGSSPLSSTNDVGPGHSAGPYVVVEPRAGSCVVVRC